MFWSVSAQSDETEALKPKEAEDKREEVPLTELQLKFEAKRIMHSLVPFVLLCINQCQGPDTKPNPTMSVLAV